MKFENRIVAGKQLVPHLKKYCGSNSIILAIPRGAVPMGYEIARELQLPMDILLTKKIGHPLNPELAVGSVSLEGIVIDPSYNMEKDFIEQETLRIRQHLQKRYQKFMGNRSSIDPRGKTVIIVDDGIATGNTMLASVDLVKNHHAKKVVVATPVASPEAIRKLENKADEVICLYTPEDFMAVGEFYNDFSEVTDLDVIEYLNRLKQHENVS